MIFRLSERAFEISSREKEKRSSCDKAKKHLDNRKALPFHRAEPTARSLPLHAESINKLHTINHTISDVAAIEIVDR